MLGLIASGPGEAVVRGRSRAVNVGEADRRLRGLWLGELSGVAKAAAAAA